jgi:hypothetical protein
MFPTAKLRLSELAPTQGFSESYALEVLVNDTLVGKLSFRHDLDEREQAENSSSTVNVTAKLYLHRVPFPATDWRLLMLAMEYLDRMVLVEQVEVIESLFNSSVGTEIPWLDAPAWLLAA